LFGCGVTDYRDDDFEIVASIVIDGGIWRRWGESAILYFPETME